MSLMTGELANQWGLPVDLAKICYEEINHLNGNQVIFYALREKIKEYC